jgi:hypothetical protein
MISYLFINKPDILNVGDLYLQVDEWGQLILSCNGATYNHS